jgi:lysophospholipase L1-like esterase
MQKKSAQRRFLSTIGAYLLLIHGLLAQNVMMAKKDSLNYLALGDSYTIGSGVSAKERFPRQLAEQLRANALPCKNPKLVARLGWSTDQLIKAMQAEQVDTGKWDLVTLLIGVNNEYRGLDIEVYRQEFAFLLDWAIRLAGGRKDRVWVLSIPDYGVTPFGQRVVSRNIPARIDQFNDINREITLTKGVAYHNITPISREVKNDKDLIAKDDLHPSGLMYKRWVEGLKDLILKAYERK